MAASGNALLKERTGERVKRKIAASQNIYDGSLAFVDASGNATTSIAAGVNKFGGIPVEQYDNSSGSAGDISGEFHRRGCWLLTGAGFAVGDVGTLVYASDNNTITKTSADHTVVGKIMEFVSATQVWVDIDGTAV